VEHVRPARGARPDALDRDALARETIFEEAAEIEAERPAALREANQTALAVALAEGGADLLDDLVAAASDRRAERGLDLRRGDAPALAE
jgi:hypothetical protein